MVCHSEENKGVSTYLYFLQSLFLNTLLLHQIQSLSCVDFPWPFIMLQSILASDIKLKPGYAKKEPRLQLYNPLRSQIPKPPKGE